LVLNLDRKFVLLRGYIIHAKMPIPSAQVLEILPPPASAFGRFDHPITRDQPITPTSSTPPHGVI